jgi:hypothetical protein
VKSSIFTGNKDIAQRKRHRHIKNKKAGPELALLFHYMSSGVVQNPALLAGICLANTAVDASRYR